MPLQFTYDRAPKELKGDGTGDRVARQAQQGDARNFAKGNGLAGLHINAPEVDGSLLMHDVFDEVEIANRDAARGEDQVGMNGLAELLAQALGSIAGHAQALGNTTRLANGGFQQVTVAIANLARLQFGVDIYDLVARAQDRHTWSTHHLHLSVA